MKCVDRGAWTCSYIYIFYWWMVCNWLTNPFTITTYGIFRTKIFESTKPLHSHFSTEFQVGHPTGHQPTAQVVCIYTWRHWPIWFGWPRVRSSIWQILTKRPFIGRRVSLVSTDLHWNWPIIWDVSKNRGGPPKSSILIGFSIINHPFWGYPYFWKHPSI